MNSFAQQSKETISQFEIGYKNRDVNLLKHLFSDSLIVGIHSNPEAYRLVEGIVTKYKVLEKLEFVKEKKSKKGKEVIVNCLFKDEQLFHSTILLDENNKIVRFNFFDQLCGLTVNDQEKSKLVAVLPFEFIDNKIIIKVKVNANNRELRILFDTGADGMGLKKSVADEIGIKVNQQQQTHAVGATTNVGISKDNTLFFDTLKITNQRIAVFPRMEGQFDGLLGGNLLRKYITEINFDNSVIKLYSFGKMKYPKNGSFVPLGFSSGIPEIVCSGSLNNDKAFNGDYAFDTGASYPIIFFGPYVKKADLLKNFNIQFHSQTHSMGHASETVNGIINDVKLGNWQVKNFSGTIQKPAPEQSQLSERGVNGSFGIDLIKRFNCFINIYNREYYLLPNKNFNQPFDFWLGNILLGFTKDELIVKQIIQTEEMLSCNIQKNDVVTSINGVSAEELTKSDQINQFTKEWKGKQLELILTRADQGYRVVIPSL